MFFVKYGNEYIHDPRKDLFLTAANPEVELNASGSFTFTMQYNNPLYDKLVERDTKNPITVWQDDELIFIGDIINIESGFKKYKEVECRGILGWLNDSIVRPYSTLESENDNVAPDGIAGYFEWLINNHNSQVEDTKKFKIDKNEGQSLDSKIYRSDSSYTNTGELIKNKILDEVGGYVIPKEENGEHVIDLIREMPEDNSQLIDFGKNLLDYVSSEDTDGMYTFVIPTGVMAEKESDNSEKATHNITIGERTVTDLTRAMDNRKVEYEEAQKNSSTPKEDLKAAEEACKSAEAALEDAKIYTLDGIVEEGYFKQGDIIYSEAAVKEYGWIGCPVAFDNTTLVSELIRNGILALKGMESPVRTIEVKAVDLSMIKPNYSPIRVGQYVRVRSKPHNFDSYMLCSKISYDLNQPDQNTFTLGQTYDVLTGIQNKKIKALNESVNHVYSSAERISDEAKAIAGATKAIAGATKKNEEEINNVRETLSAAVSSHTHNTLDVKSSNPITSTSNDTTANWAKHGNSIHWYNTGGCLIDQPHQCGILLNNVCGSDVRQIFFAQPGGNMYHRGGNESGWSGSWKALLDSSNFTSWAASKLHSHSVEEISGVLPVSKGGTGYGSISSSSTITDYMSLNTTNTSAITGKVARWGPVLQFDITFTLKISLDAVNITNATLGTFKDAYRPKISFGCCSSDTGGLVSFSINTSGDLKVCATHADFAVGDNISASGMYLLA